MGSVYHIMALRDFKDFYNNDDVYSNISYCKNIGHFNPTWEGVQIPWIGGGGLNQPPPLEINEGVVSDPRLLYRSLT